MKNKYVMPHVMWLFAGILAICTLHSCDRSADTAISIGEAQVVVSVSGIELDDEGDLEPSAFVSQGRILTGSATVDAISTYPEEGDLIAVVPFSEKLSIFASIEEDRSSEQNRTLAARAGSKAAIVRTPLQPGVRYRMIVFDPAGAYKDQREYIYGQENSAAPLLLDAGLTYTFVAYSFNNSAAIPPFPTTSGLNTASLTGLTGDFLYYKQSVPLVFGNNNLGIILKHMFSQISTVLTLGTTVQGNIEGIGQPTIRPNHDNASISFADNNMTYGAAVSVGAAVSFPSLGAGMRTISASPVMLIAPNVTNGNFNFGLLTVDRYTRRDVTIPNIKVSPGKRYTLTLRVDAPCINRSEVRINVNGGGEQTFSFSNPNQGIVLDFTSLDNSFRFRMNNVDAITGANGGEIQFSNSTAYPQNIQFADGTRYGVEHPSIWTIQGTATNPVVRFLISPSGQITMFGSKTSGGELFQLVPMPGYGFATGAAMNFNPRGNNIARLSQVVVGPTVRVGTIGGRRVCTN